MRSARDGRPRLLGGVLTLLLFVVAFTTDASADAGPMRVVVRIAAPIDEALYERTLGQVSDLAAELYQERSPALEDSMTARLMAARTLAVRHHAAMVVWFEHPPNAGPVVYVALPSRDRVLVRHIGETSEALSSSTSAMLEASALAVRTALVALESGVAVGVPTAELAPPPAPPPPVLETSPLAAPRPPHERPHSSYARRPRWEPFAGAGWQISFDGRSPWGARAGLLEAGLRHGPWSGALRGSLGLPTRSHDELVTLEVWRHSAGAFAARTLVTAGPWTLDVAAGVGLVLFGRSAFPRDARFAPSPSITHRSAAGSIELRMAWTPSITFPVHLGLGAGIDALSSPPSFAYETPTGRVDRPAWFVEPRVMFVASLVF
jgi:hypothetical protein